MSRAEILVRALGSNPEIADTLAAFVSKWRQHAVTESNIVARSNLDHLFNRLQQAVKTESKKECPCPHI